MTGTAEIPGFGAPALPGLPQGSVVMIENGIETVVHLGTGHAPA